MEIKFRKLLHSDIPHLIGLRIKQLKDEGAIASCDITEYLKEYYENNISNNSFVGYIAECADGIIVQVVCHLFLNRHGTVI